MIALTVVLAGLIGALVYAVRDRRAKERRFQAALAQERHETFIRYVEEERESGKYESFSNWPMGPRSKP